MEMPDEVWMHVENGALSCHTRAINPASVAFVPLLRAVKAEARIRALEAALQLIGNELSLHADQGPAGEAFRALLVPTLETDCNQAAAAPSDAVNDAPTPRGSLPNSLGASLETHQHLLYSIHTENWVEEVGCEECDLKIVGRKAPKVKPEMHHAHFAHCALHNNGDYCTCGSQSATGTGANMKKYMFTGHLDPLPPGIKLRIGLSGEVYLPCEVDEEIRRLNAVHAKEIADYQERLRKVTRRSMGFKNRRSKANRGGKP